ncbi:MAG: PAS domain-containing protein, partial [Candidatus Competibacter sp.]|nr:PAS domain-containing protein [Candidatus Competibacter sp.]
MVNRNLNADDKDGDRVIDPPTSADLAEIVRIFDDPIIVVDESQRIVFFNDGAQETFGYDSAEILG